MYLIALGIISILLVVMIVLTNVTVENEQSMELFASRVPFPGKTRSFDSEMDLAKRSCGVRASFGKPTKCFDCEAQYERMYGPQYVFMSQPSKSYDADRELMRKFLVHK